MRVLISPYLMAYCEGKYIHGYKILRLVSWDNTVTSIWGRGGWVSFSFTKLNELSLSIMLLTLKQQILSLNFSSFKTMKVSLVLPTISQTYGLSCIWNVSKTCPAHTSILSFPHVWARAILSCFVDLFEIINFLLGSICMQELVFSCMESVFHF